MACAVINIKYDPMLVGIAQYAAKNRAFAEQFQSLLDNGEAITINKWILHPSNALLDAWHEAMGV